MATWCLKPIKANVIRVTKLNSCGVPVLGAKASATSEGFVSIEATMEVEDGQDYQLKGANDKYIYNSRGRPRLRWVNLTINFGQVDPEVYNLITGMPLVMNDAGTPEAVGFRLRENVYADFALEAWTDLDGLACVGGVPAYGYALFPWIKDARLGDVTFENGPISFPVTSARTEKNSLWGTGPYNVDNKLSAPTGPSKLLTPVTAEDHMDFHLTTLAPPAAVCGAVTLS